MTGSVRFLLLFLILSPVALATPVVPGVSRLQEVEGPSSATQGRVLLRELGCAACHSTGSPEEFSVRPGPLLDGLRFRVRPDYLRAWLADPHSQKPGTSMPDLLSDLEPEERVRAAEALTHYLLGDDAIEALVPHAADPPTEPSVDGATLFHTIGCVSCHEPRREPKAPGADLDDIFADEAVTVVANTERTVPSVPLPDLAAKTNRSALAQFLRSPHDLRPSGRMPDMKLTAAEADAVADYLLADTVPGPWPAFVADAELAEEGRRRFSELRCNACHAKTDAPEAQPSPPWEIAAGAGRCAGPANFDLDADQRRSIELALAAPPQAPTLHEEITALNCFACHERAGTGGVDPGRDAYFVSAVDADLGDEGRLPPTLTGVGAKLTEAGLRAILLEGTSVRPYMATRMPQFGAENVAHFIPALLEIDANPDAPSIDVSGLKHHHRNHYGRQLMGTDGLSCITCHDLNGQRSLGIPAIDLAHTPGRIQPSWFKQYLLDPASLRPGTRMPAFFPDGKSTFPDLWNGDAHKQIEALWIYLREIDQTRLPVGMEDRGDFKLVPHDRPLLHRTFMEGVGAQAIAVGFPGGLNVAFDAAHPRFALAWTGDFIDGESAQADRFSPFVKPLGELRALFPEGPLIAELENDDSPWPVENSLRFAGYTLDPSGIPTFTYHTSDGTEIRDTVWPEASNSLRRRVEIGAHTTGLHLLLSRTDATTPNTGPHTTVISGETTARVSNGKTEIIAALPPSDSVSTVEWELSW